MLSFDKTILSYRLDLEENAGKFPAYSIYMKQVGRCALQLALAYVQIATNYTQIHGCEVPLLLQG
jgi:hypothetical protein